jgi:primosomal protein N' (replication factor Y)
MVFVRVAVNVTAVTGEFDYHLPAALEGVACVGSLVRVPFGAQTAQGVLLEFVSEPAVAHTKAVLELVDPLPALTPAQIEFARQLAAETLNPLAAIVDLMIPPGLSQHADVLYEIIERRAENRTSSAKGADQFVFPTLTSLTMTQKRLVDLLAKRGALRGRQIDRHFERVEWRKSAQSLVRQGLLNSTSVLPPAGVRPKFIRTAHLAVAPELAEAAMLELGRTEAALERRQKALRFLMREPEPINVSWVYAESGCTLADLQELAERELVILSEAEIFRDPVAGMQRREKGTGTHELILTSDQQAVVAEVLAAFAGPPSTNLPFLLHGVTGSGKTEIYLRAAAEALRRGKQALILVPEIALTAQMVHRFMARFPGRVGLVHSRLSDGERYDTWRRARSGQLAVIIGARSALFAPLPDIGLIVVDECHDGSYAQSEPPFYHAVTAAQSYARISGAVCILGSATPPVALRFEASPSPVSVPALTPTPLPVIPLRGRFAGERKVRLLELPGRITPIESGGVSEGTLLPPVHIVDMREELKAGNRGIFSRELSEALAEVLERGEQAILFMNRRGTATYVFCRECGYVVKCPNCETPLTQHTEAPGDDGAQLNCHRCGYTRKMPQKCPVCGGTQIRAYGLGSERVEQEAQALFPAARTLRWDWETTREKDAHELILTHFANHQADVLIGTQMLAKGLDLPLVTLVGIVLADVGLNLPDPFAGERSFQVLTQVAGRAGRSSRGGRVVLQTFQPEHYAIQAAAGHDYSAFYTREIEYRRKLGYPPFARLLRLEFRHRDNAEAEKEAQALAGQLKTEIIAQSRIETDLVGPAPCFFAKVNGLYRWQIILRGPEPVTLVAGNPPDGWRIEVDPVSLL